MAVAILVFVEIILMVFLGGKEVLERCQLHGEFLPNRLFFPLECRFQLWQVRVVKIVNTRAIPRSSGTALSGVACGSDGLEIKAGREANADDTRVVNHLYRFPRPGDGVEAHAVHVVALPRRVQAVSAWDPGLACAAC